MCNGAGLVFVQTSKVPPLWAVISFSPNTHPRHPPSLTICFPQGRADSPTSLLPSQWVSQVLPRRECWPLAAGRGVTWETVRNICDDGEFGSGVAEPGHTTVTTSRTTEKSLCVVGKAFLMTCEFYVKILAEVFKDQIALRCTLSKSNYRKIYCVKSVTDLWPDVVST